MIKAIFISCFIIGLIVFVFIFAIVSKYEERKKK